jgi:hypothetical protein
MGRAMLADWNRLPEDMQITLSREALRRATATIATQAEVLAQEMECGGLADRGGADALRLFAAVVRVGGRDDVTPAGHG